MQQQLTPAKLIFGVGAIVCLLGSFLRFAGSGNFGVNAWSTEYFAFASTVPALLAIIGLVWIGLQVGGVKLPTEIITFNHKQLKATWGISAGGIMVSWLTANESAGVGFWLMLIGAIAMAVGSVLELLGVADDPMSGATKAPAGFPNQQQYGAAPTPNPGTPPPGYPPTGQPGAPTPHPGAPTPPPGAPTPPPGAPGAPTPPAAPPAPPAAPGGSTPPPPPPN